MTPGRSSPGFSTGTAKGLVFVPNATTAVNAVLRSLDLRAGDRIVSTTHGYPACRYAAREIAASSGAEAIEVEIPIPLSGPDDVLTALFRHDEHSADSTFGLDPLQRRLSEYGVEVLAVGPPAWPRRLLRISTHLYNTVEDLERLQDAMDRI